MRLIAETTIKRGRHRYRYSTARQRDFGRTEHNFAITTSLLRSPFSPLLTRRPLRRELAIGRRLLYLSKTCCLGSNSILSLTAARRLSVALEQNRPSRALFSTHTPNTSLKPHSLLKSEDSRSNSSNITGKSII